MSAFSDYFSDMMPEARLEVHSCPELMELIGRVGFLPLLESGIPGYCAKGMMAEECRFVRFADNLEKRKPKCAAETITGISVRRHTLAISLHIALHIPLGSRAS